MSNYQERIINPYENLLILQASQFYLWQESNRFCQGFGGQIPPSLKLRRSKRGVAQLVAYYVRDVGAGSSSLLTPTHDMINPQ